MEAVAAIATVLALAACGDSGPAALQHAQVHATRPAATPAVSPSAASPGRSSPPASQPSPPATQPSAKPSVAPPPGPQPTGPAPITGRLAGTDWTYIPTTQHVVALTFDAGANADGVASILATLQRYGVPATFFLTGNFVRDFPGAARSIAAAGERIGDHTVSHPYLTGLTDAAVRQQITDAAQQIVAVTGKNPAPLFRFPYGDADARTIAIANQAGYVPVRWTVDTLGWEGTSGHITAAIVASRVLNAVRPGEIVLMHVGSNPDDHTTFDADALAQVIGELRAIGYSFVTLDALTS